ncbi:cysteine-rich protein 2-like isoform X1 [Gopherus flavomarginatus]|uniref:cysteine-rich protein 2-like isoform X1 n=1 Tax=Gopherus flavomarginatus TaxID=286002 RepID=UPI0021CBED0A|nr:cysteine-rich protein 2-like isoform X1 [Gopherus flavomarginatus]
MISYCPICGKPVYFAERKRSLGKDYHPLCLKCYQCKRQLSPGQHAEEQDGQRFAHLSGQLPLPKFQWETRTAPRWPCFNIQNSETHYWTVIN